MIDNRGTTMAEKTWVGKWITDAAYDFEEGESPIPMEFRIDFPIKDKKIKAAWIDSTAWGIYEIELNGEKLGQDYFVPGCTSYKHQLQYQTYNMTANLEEQNSIRVFVAGGWAVGVFHMSRKNKIDADNMALLAEIHILYEDGEETIIGTDEDWQVTQDSSFRMAQWYDGETYDATRREEDKRWKKADVTTPRHNPKILAQYGAPVRAQEHLMPQMMFQAKSGEYIYDFGQNFAGVISAKIKGREKQEIVFRHAEILVENELFVKTLRTAKATATYICKDGEQEYSPRFTYMGFRYVGVRGIEPENMELSAIVLHSDIEEVGTFSCSNELINRLQENIRWSGKSNFVDIPTDCPQRDERLGWTGDIAVFAKTACYNFDMSKFLNKWLLDMNAEQVEDGGIPFVIPQGADTWNPMVSACWGDSCILVPWAEYLARGDIELLKRQYPVMKKFLKGCEKRASLLSVGKHKYIWSLPYQWGDWCAPDTDMLGWWLRAPWIATAYFANSAKLVAQIARILGEEEDASYYEELFQKIKQAYRDVFTNKKGKVKREFQSAYVLPLAFGMVEPEEIDTMVENLQKLIDKKGGHIATGFPGTPYILYALSDNGRSDLAYRLLLQETCPSWLYEVKAGATTIWERYDALREDGTVNFGDEKKKNDDSDGGMVSFNHYANGAVGAWLYERCLGLEAIEGGYKKFQFKPIIGGGLTWANGSVKTPFGQVCAKWSIEENLLTMEIDVPEATTCDLIFPDGESHSLKAGHWEYKKEWKGEN